MLSLLGSFFCLIFVGSNYKWNLLNIAVVTNLLVFISVLSGYIYFINLNNFSYLLPYDVGIFSDTESINEVVLIFLIFQIGISFGYVAASIYFKERSVFEHKVFNFTESSIFLINVFLILSLILFILNMPINMLFERNIYIPDNEDSFTKSFAVLFLMIFYTILCFTDRVFLKYFWLLVFSIFLFGLGSRLILFPFLIVLFSNIILQPKNIYSLNNFIILILLIFFVSTAQYIRGADNHGIIPYFIFLQEAPIFLLIFESFLYNFAFSFGITLEIIESDIGTTTSELLIALNPTPSFLDDSWVKIANERRLYDTAPLNSISELWMYNPLALFIYSIVTGHTLGIIMRRYQNSFLYIVLAIIACYFVFNLMQYNLRASTKILWFMIIFSLGQNLMSALQILVMRKTTNLSKIKKRTLSS